MSSSSVHSRYQRHLTDLPWGTHAVHLQLTVRRFLCRTPTCARRIFTERLPDFAATHARKTMRLVTALQAVGVDEWAWRRGHRYGTILVDLAPHRVVDLLPDRAAASVAAWLAQHPTVTTVCRDRRDLYADGIRRGAPQAVQVVARFHLVHNLRHALEAFLLDRRLALQDAAISGAMALMPTASPVPLMPMSRGRHRHPKPAQQEEAARPPRHARWVAIYEAVHALRAQGTPIATMARRLGISRPTVYAYLRRDRPPGPRRLQRPPSARVLTPYTPYLIRRWRESGVASRQLWRAIQLSHAFLTMVRKRRGPDLEAWMAEAMHSGIEELARFARGLQEDLAAVTAGLTLDWSNGPGEGQITRLKRLKRQGYGRAGVPLLRQRLRHAA
jgi:transposase